jgi:hypothetical protein
MPLRNRLRDLVRTAPFWSDYLGDEVFGEPVTGLPDNSHLAFPLSPQHSLRIGYFWRASEDKDEDFIEARDLWLHERDSGKDTILGWRFDDGHAHPHALRWEEADLIGRLQALRDPELPHPGIPFLLLLPYIASIEASDHRKGLRLLNTALRSLGVFNERQIRYRLSAFNRIPANSEWRRIRPYGWVCYYPGGSAWESGGRTIYSLRQVQIPSYRDSFPFAVWNSCMRHAKRTVAEDPQARVQKTRAKRLPHLSEHIELRYQLTDCEEAYSTLPVLRRALFREGLGVCYLTGSWGAFEEPDNVYLAHPKAADEYVIDCYGELAAIVEVFRRIVEEAGHPDVRLFQRMFQETSRPYRRIAL